jgi:hypothetical protein
MQSTGILVAILAGTLASLSANAVAQTSPADAEAQVRAAQQNAITDRYLTTVQVAMASTIDTKNAVVGQEVSAKTLAEVRLADDTVLPKGTRLVGRVLQARAGGPEQGSSILTLTFDRAEVKPGQSVPVRSVIRAVAPNAPASRESMAVPPTVMPASGPGAGTNRRGGVAGGMPGTVPTIGGGGRTGTGGTMPPLGMPSGSGAPDGMPDGGMPGTTVPSGTDSGPVIGGRTADPGALGGTSSAPATRRVADVGESVSGAPHSTGLPGVLLWTAPTASGTLTAMGRNIALESGMQMTLGVIAR